MYFILYRHLSLSARETNMAFLSALDFLVFHSTFLLYFITNIFPVLWQFIRSRICEKSHTFGNFQTFGMILELREQTNLKGPPKRSSNPKFLFRTYLHSFTREGDSAFYDIRYPRISHFSVVTLFIYLMKSIRR